MIAVVLVLINLTTAILLSGIEDGMQTWRLSQHDVQLARARRAADSTQFMALAQFQQGLAIPETLNLPAKLQATLQKTPLNCSEIPSFVPRTTSDTSAGANCWRLLIEVSQAAHNLRIQQTFWLIEYANGERVWQHE
ncbi:hypothetical protein CWE13_05360 [Aliidiomarina shirensis]|uniref:Type II secretion system protein n=1 Tax=Aliidiomarina shirensis TaxID=1048642 RepID=A0A432WUF0_9GAMM|nr:hypothetical protein [Aliidiomarina shirensis]RUO37388.1 hypothetical protein CWE13_05360 [Aliidiomarina shirensis]